MFRCSSLVLGVVVFAAAGASLGAAETLVLVAGGGTNTVGPAHQARLSQPFGVDLDSSGTLFIAELTGQRVLKVDTRGILSVLAGTGAKGDTGDEGPATQATFNGMHHLAIGPEGALFIADTWNNRVRRIDLRSGTITAFAGTGIKGFAGDGGPALKAQFGGIYCLAFDSRGERLYLADLDNRRIRAVDMRTGIVSTVAGNGRRGVPEDGAEAVKAPLVDPRAVAVDAQGSVYILERSGHALRVVDNQGKIRTVAGTGKPGATGDGGDALKAMFKGPKHLCIDQDGGVLIADTENHVIRKYLPREGKVVRLAGTGKKGTGGLGGSPDRAELAQPHGVHVDKNGTLYIADSSNNRVVKIVR
jgi:sugar lactone lactonase YvrE